ncbi:hypothetical protein D3C73_945280 [compost metagenome]
MLFGIASASASPITTDSISPYANLNLVLRVGEVYNFNGAVFMLNNPQNAIVIQFGTYVKGLQPGQATVSVYSNGQYTNYDIFVKAN